MGRGERSDHNISLEKFSIKNEKMNNGNNRLYFTTFIYSVMLLLTEIQFLD